MLRLVLSLMVVLALSVGFLAAKDNNAKDNKAVTKHQATITKVDKNKGTVTVKMKNKEGKDVERTFKLAEDIRYLDSTGKVAAVDIFRSGDEVLVVEAEGRLRELHHKGKGDKGKVSNPGAK
jgi:hypothetical protein